MWTIFCASHDQAAIWAWDGLRRRGLDSIEVVTSEALAYSRLWEHRVGSDGALFRVGLQDGRLLCSSRIRGVLNRLNAPALDLVQHAAASDREYAICEMQAFYLSWLNSISGVVINRPHPIGLSGAWRHTSEWAIRASRAGVPTPSYRQSGRDAADRGYFPITPEGVAPECVIVLRDRVFGADIPEPLKAACVRMARAEGLEMLGIDFYRDKAGQLIFGHANPAPYLPIGGEPLLDYMVEIFRNGGAK